MSFPLICRACGARLKVPTEAAAKKARCPKCRARVNVAPVLDATAYMPALADFPSPAAKPTTASRAVAVKSAPVSAKAQEIAPLSLDDDPPSANSAKLTPPVPAALNGPPPFRVPARVTADTARLFAGPCEVVLLAHGLFLESVPYRPFLYVPVGSPVDTPGRNELTVYMPDGRAITVQMTGGNASRLAEDSAAYLGGLRAVPNPRDYRGIPKWLFWAALAAVIGAIGLAAYLAGRHNAAG